MANLNKPSTRGALKTPYRPGVFTAPGNQTLSVLHPAMVDALVKLGWTRTAD